MLKYLLSIVVLALVSDYCTAFFSSKKFGHGFGKGLNEALYLDDSYGSYGSLGSYEPFHGFDLDFGPSYGDSYGSSLGSYGSYKPYRPIKTPFKRRHRVDIRPLHTVEEPIHPQVLHVPAIQTPVKIFYFTQSSPVHVQQVHKKGAPGHVQATKTEEEPHKVYHEVVRPVIQEIREIILPYRRVVQKIEPVVEDIQTYVAQGVGPKSQLETGGALGGSLYGGAAPGGSLYGGAGIDLGKGLTLGDVYKSAAASSAAKSAAKA